MMRRQGFSLVELMIAMTIMTIVGIYVSYTFTSADRAHDVATQVSEVQQNSRIVAHLLERDLRVTGFLVPEAAALCGIDRTDGTDILYVTDADSLDPASATRNDLGASISLGFSGGPDSDDLTLEDLILDGAPFYDADADGTPDSDFRAGSGAIIVDRANPERGSACGAVGEVTVGSKTIRLDYSSLGGGSLGAIPVGGNAPDLVAVPAHRYEIIGEELQRDGMTVAYEVEDLQLAAFFDLNDDGAVASEALEYPGSPTGVRYQSSAWNVETLREVRISLVMRVSNEDPRFAQGRVQDSENRVSLDTENDGFRRRTLSATVRPRNLGYR
jgi:prepilin-type N-terminal cleavage/methylation domain-containing protein